MQDNNEAGASPALVERALEDCRTWQALPDANGAAHVLAAEIERLRAEVKGRAASNVQLTRELSDVLGEVRALLDVAAPLDASVAAGRRLRARLGMDDWR